MNTQVVKGSASFTYIQSSLVIIFIKARQRNQWVSLVGDSEFQGGNSFQNQSWWFQNKSCLQSNRYNFYIEDFLKEEATGTKFSWESNLTIHHLAVTKEFPNSVSAGQEAAQSMTLDPGACSNHPSSVSSAALSCETSLGMSSISGHSCGLT